MEQSVLTVNDLVETQSLGTRVLAGASGLERQVLWAHSCELNDPARWLGPHELLMTVGLCVPQGAEDQSEFIRRLHEAGLAGVALGDHPSLPALTQELLDEADKLGFPVLLTAEETPFAAIGRTVAAATATTQTLQVLKLSKLYQLSTYAHADPERLIDDLQALFRSRLTVQDVHSGLTILEGPPLPSLTSTARQRSYTLPGERGVKLLVGEYPGEEISSFLLIHILQVVDVAVSQLLTSIRERAERYRIMLEAILEGRIPENIDDVLKPSAMTEGYKIVAIKTDDGPKAARAISIAALPVLTGAGRKSYFLMAPEPSLSDTRKLIEDLGIRAAASSTYMDVRDAKVAAEEAYKVLSSGGANDNWVDFSGAPISLLARSRKEAAGIIQQVLGELAAADPKTTALRNTLFSFLENDRRWNETAAELGIHRQTLSYRLSKIKETTGRDTSSSADFAALWLAYQAWLSYPPVNG
ncbi:transcciptional activator PmfR [Paenarthrobacter sp. 2TAF44]|uniref:transcciptional activator PmfR n=1 Tax=Paenarthrobacter sp. 2TAF44 TaxID=3233018 RepID=UPI003F96EC64